jgi:hypothetical protein
MYSDCNNYLSAHTTDGTGRTSTSGTNITDKLHVGVQLYDRNGGHRGNWQPKLDWYTSGYKFKGWMGFGGGKVKTILGLCSEDWIYGNGTGPGPGRSHSREPGGLALHRKLLVSIVSEL